MAEWKKHLHLGVIYNFEKISGNNENCNGMPGNAN